MRLTSHATACLAAIAAMSLLAGCDPNTSASNNDIKITSGFKDQVRLSTEPNQQVEVGRISLGTGTYSIFAKLYLETHSADGATIKCVLDSRRGDYDQTVVTHNGAASVALNVVHSYTEDGSAVLTCGHEGSAGDTTLRFVKITAVRGSSLTNEQMR